MKITEKSNECFFEGWGRERKNWKIIVIISWLTNPNSEVFTRNYLLLNFDENLMIMNGIVLYSTHTIDLTKNLWKNWNFDRNWVITSGFCWLLNISKEKTYLLDCIIIFVKLVVGTQTKLFDFFFGNELLRGVSTPPFRSYLLRFSIWHFEVFLSSKIVTSTLL